MGTGGCWFSHGEILVAKRVLHKFPLCDCFSRLQIAAVACSLMGDSDLFANTHQLLPEWWENVKSAMPSGSKRLSSN